MTDRRRFRSARCNVYDRAMSFIRGAARASGTTSRDCRDPVASTEASISEPVYQGALQFIALDRGANLPNALGPCSSYTRSGRQTLAHDPPVIVTCGKR
jgi:hypothetical protein